MNKRRKLIAITLSALLALPACLGACERAFADSGLKAASPATDAPSKAAMSSAKKPMSKAKLSVMGPVYTGKRVAPAVTVTWKGTAVLKKGRDYKVSYLNSKKKKIKASKVRKAGAYYVRVKGRGKYTGSKTVRFKVLKDTWKDATVGRIPTQAYTGFAVKPPVSVSCRGKALVEGVDYTLSYEGNRNSGTARVTVTGKGVYSGKKRVPFKIGKPKVAQVFVYGFNNSAAYVLGSDTATMYTGKMKEIEFLSNEMPKVASDTWLSSAWAINPGSGAIVMPGGVAEMIWTAHGRPGAPDMISVWTILLMRASKSPTSLTDHYADYGEIPTWFSGSLFELDKRSTSVGNYWIGKRWVLITR